MASIAEHPQSGYTQAERDLIAKCLKDGESANQIGARIGRSRNAVIGVVNRDQALREIGFSRKPGEQVGCGRLQRNGSRNVARPQRIKRGQRSVPQPPTKQAPKSVPRKRAPHVAGQPLGNIRPNHCRFAVNDAGRGETHLFCGLPSDGMWCEFHRGLVYQPRSSLRDRAA